MKTRFLPALAVVAALAAPAAGHAHDDHHWRDWLDCERLEDRGVRHCETIKGGWKATGAPIVVESSPNGGAIVIGWDEDRVEVEAFLHARGATQREAEDLARQVDVRMQANLVTATGPRNDSRWSVTFVVHAPKRSDLRLTSHNGPVGVEQVNGAMTLATHNGPISLVECGGDVQASTTNGPLDVRLAGERWTGKGLVAETRNGPVELSIPRRYSAVLESGTLNGPVDVDLPVRMRRGRYFTTELGQGGTALRIVTRNGPITVRRI